MRAALYLDRPHTQCHAVHTPFLNIESGHGGAADNKQRAFMSTLASLLGPAALAQPRPAWPAACGWSAAPRVERVTLNAYYSRVIYRCTTTLCAV
jgi:hypothetical protein